MMNVVLACVQEMMNQARQDTSGIKLEVNERFALPFTSYEEKKKKNLELFPLSARYGFTHHFFLD